MLMSSLVVVSSVVYKVFYHRTTHCDALEARKRDQCVAQMHGILASQWSEFRLSELEAQQLLDKDPSDPKVFEEPDELVVKPELRVVCLEQGKRVEKSLKGRRLRQVHETPVATTQELQAAVAAVPPEAWPCVFVLEADPPTAQRLFELVVCDVHDRPMTQRGVPDDARFRACAELFRARLAAELEEAAKKTLFARGLGELPPGERKHCGGFASGQKLRELLKLQTHARRHRLGCDPAVVKQAQEALQRVGLDQRARLWPLVELLKPSVPYWAAACLLHGSLECVVAKLCTGQANIMDLVATKQVDVQGARLLTAQWIAGWVVIHLFGWYFAHLFKQRAVAQFGTRVKAAAMRALVQQDFEYFDKNPAGELQQRLDQDAAKLERTLLHRTMELVTECTAIVANLYLVYLMAPRDMFLAAMAPLPLIALGQWLLQRSTRSFHRRLRRLGEHAAASTAQVLTEIKTVREFAMEEREGRRYAETCELQAGVDEHRATKAGFCGHMMHILHLSGEAVTLCIGAEKVACGEMRAGELVAIMMMVSCMIGGKLRGVFERLAELAFVVEPAGRIADLLEASPKIEPTNTVHALSARDAAELATVLSGQTLTRGFRGVPAGRAVVEVLGPRGLLGPCEVRFSAGLRPARLGGRVEFQDVEFRYPADPRKCVLRHLSFAVEAGQSVALVGHAGCGKSTIFKLVQRLYEPTRGRVLLDGRELGEYDVHFLRRKVAVVAQENVLFAGTILDNVAYGVDPAPTLEQVRGALAKASALEFVDAFPDNVHSRVGARGLALSGGQRQRVAIARAMVRQPYMLILDEATSALDPTNEKVVQAALDELVQTSGATSLTIAHRLTTVKDCDKILVFSDGRLVEEGTHASLLQIPVEKSAPRGTQPGSVTQGFYASQWRSMMGEPGALSPRSASTAPSSGTARPSVQELEWQEEVVRSRQDVEAAQRLASTVARDYARVVKELEAVRRAAAPVPAPAAPPPLAAIIRATSAPHKLAPPHARPCA